MGEHVLRRENIGFALAAVSVALTAVAGRNETSVLLVAALAGCVVAGLFVIETRRRSRDPRDS
jgi:hypothetical protein